MRARGELRGVLRRTATGRGSPSSRRVALTLTLNELRRTHPLKEAASAPRSTRPRRALVGIDPAGAALARGDRAPGPWRDPDAARPARSRCGDEIAARRGVDDGDARYDWEVRARSLQATRSDHDRGRRGWTTSLRVYADARIAISAAHDHPMRIEEQGGRSATRSRRWTRRRCMDAPHARRSAGARARRSPRGRWSGCVRSLRTTTPRRCFRREICWAARPRRRLGSHMGAQGLVGMARRQRDAAVAAEREARGARDAIGDASGDRARPCRVTIACARCTAGRRASGR